MIRRSVEVAGGIIHTDFDAEDLPWAGGAHVFRLWCERRGDRDMPSRADFSPHDMVPYLPFVVLVDVLHDPLRFRNRLVGTALAELLPNDPTGIFMDELPNGEVTAARLALTVNERHPTFSTDLPLDWANRDYRSFDAIGMPLSSDGQTVDMIMTVMSLRPATQAAPRGKGPVRR